MKTILSFLCIAVAAVSYSQLSVDAFGTDYTIYFDDGVDDVNEDPFDGSGLESSPANGRLDSDAWEILGLSDGDLNFGGTGTSGDYARGSSTGGVTTGGIYSFEVATGDFALGVQPGGSDVTPGSITLKIDNNTGLTFGDIELDYDLYVLNNEDRASSWDLEYSTDNTNWTAVVGSNLVSTAAQDASPVWTANAHNFTISGTAVPDGGSLYLRWTTDDDSGSGSRDEFALDNINVNVMPNSPIIFFDDIQYRENEDGASIDVDLTLLGNNGSASAVKVKALTDGTADASDYTMASGLEFTGTSDETVGFTITINDDATAENTEYIALYLEDSTNATAHGEIYSMVYILDNDFTAPAPSESITLDFIDSIYIDGGSAEISAFDPTTNKLYTANSTENMIEVIDFSNPHDLSLITSIDVSTYGDLNSIDVYNDTVAVAVANSTDVTLDGSIVFFLGDGTHLNTITAGANPDMVIYTPNHSTVLVANEGEPSDDYLTDPEGTVTIIDVTAGVNNAVATEVDFNAYDSQIATLIASGVRIIKPGATVSEDVEPEYITIDPTSSTAWITLQENNAIAVLNIGTATITDIYPLGLKDHSLPGNGMDISNETDTILIANWPVYGMYQPDAIANFSVGGNTYLVTANEGDAKDYAGFSEEDRMNDLDLDDATFGMFEHFLVEDQNAGRIKITYENGDDGNDGDYDSVFVYGTRSFSIWDDAGNQVYDSGDDFEQIIAHDATWSQIFNCSNSNVSFKNRSDDKGPEPEGVTVGTINDTIYAFITLERVGGIMVYDVTTPASPIFVDYVNNRDIMTATGDLGPEGIIFIDSLNSPIDTALVVVSNEVSGTVSVFSVDQYYAPDFTSIEEEVAETEFMVYPNPVNGTLFFNQVADVEIMDLSGKVVLRATQADKVDVSELTTGVYLIKEESGKVKKFIKQ